MKSILHLAITISVTIPSALINITLSYIVKNQKKMFIRTRFLDLTLEYPFNKITQFGVFYAKKMMGMRWELERLPTDSRVRFHISLFRKQKTPRKLETS